MGYYLEDNPNRSGPMQYGWPRTRVSGVIGVHTTESGVYYAGGDPGAENTARFISGRGDYGSYHSLADWDSRIKLTRPTFAAWADTTNNVHALSVSGAMDAARWRDLSPERAAGIVRNMGIAAAELVQDAIAHGVLAAAPPARRITAQQAIKGSAAGFYGHGETNPGTRYDPGQNFDWDLFLAAYASAIGGGITPQGTIKPITASEEDDLAYSEAQIKQLVTEGVQDYFRLKGEMQDGRNVIDHLNQTRTDVVSAKEIAAGVPQAVLFDNRVDGRNLFDWLKQLRADVVNIQPGQFDAQATAQALAELLPKQDAAALADRLQIIVKAS